MRGAEKATDRLLGPMPERLREAAAETLWKKHVEVRFGAAVEDYDGERVRLKGGEVVPALTVIWAAGAQAVGLTRTLGVPTGRQGRIPVEPTLQLAGHPEVFVIGDAAYLEARGQPLPMMAPVAIQMAVTATAKAATDATLLADILQEAKGDIKEALSSFQSVQLRYGHELHQYGVALGNRSTTAR